MNAKQLLLEAMDAPPRHGIVLLNGRYLEGYILEILDTYIVFGEGGPMAECDNEIINIVNISAVCFCKNGQYQTIKINDITTQQDDALGRLRPGDP